MKRTTALLCTLSIAATGLLGLSGVASAQEVELNPGYINGTVQVGTEIISSASIRGYSGSLQAQTSISPNAESASYTLTVQVEPLSSRVWSVYSDVYMDGGRDRLHFPSTDVTVVDGTPSVLDFVEADPCYVEGTITVNGGSLSSAYLNAYQQTPPYASAYSSIWGTNAYRFAVLPGTGYRFSGSLYLTTGTRLSLGVGDFDCPAGTTVTRDIEVDAPSSSITGAIEFAGPGTVDYYRVYASGPAYKNVWLYPPFGPTNDTTYEISDLPDGTFTVGSQAYLNNYDDYVTFPLSAFDSAFSPPNRPEIVSGSSPVVNIAASQAFIEGTVTLSGTVDNADLSWFQITSRTSDYGGGYSQDRLDLGTGSYDLVVTPGDWVLDGYRMALSRPATDPDGYLNETIYATDYSLQNQPLTVAAGETAYRDLDLPMGSVTISFTVAGGGVLTNPQLTAWCYEIDEATGWYHRYYSFYSYSTGQIDVTTGQVSVVGLKGDCTVTARAYVGGSLTSFGQFSIEIVPGVDQEVEIGGPSLSVDIESGLCIDADEITVTGLASDDVEVASVTVNGVAADLVSTGNQSDPNEVSFSAAVPIAGRGAHEIVTVATDTADKTATDTRTIYNDDGPPAVDFTPADGATFPVDTISVPVEGTVVDGSDDVSVTLNGSVVTTDAAGAFSATAAVEFGTNGENFITVVATDDCGSTAVTHKVTLIDNQPPVAVCQDVVAVAGASCTADADVDNGSYDPDGDPILLTPAPASPYAVGNHEVTLTVEDNREASDSCTATVTVQDVNADGDPVSYCAGDCDDTDAANYPGNVEICDGQDNNCDAAIDEGTPDGDGDGVCDTIDNCPSDSNSGQENCDGDTSGDVCDNDDTDGDGLTDAQEISFAGGCGIGFCPDPVDSDSDDDGLLDGFESDEDPDKNCDPCSADTDGDGVPDASDPFCNDPTLTGDCAQDLADFEAYILSLPTVVFQAPGANTVKQREQTRAHLAQIVGKAAKHLDKCQTANSTNELEKAWARVDGAEPPLDDMVGGTAEKALVRDTIEDFLYLFEIGVCGC